MALNKSFSQIDRFDNLSNKPSDKKVSVEESSKKEVVKKNKKKSNNSSEEKTNNKVVEEVKPISALSKMKIESKRKSVRKSFMITEKAASNLHAYAVSTGRTDNDFLNELLANLDDYIS